MRALFSSPFFTETRRTLANNPATRHDASHHLKHTPYNLHYYLSRIVPRGGTVCALYPKRILTSLLADIAKEKNCRIITHAAPGAPPQADLYLAEPDAFTPGGALASPKEAPALAQCVPIGVGSALQWTRTTPATHDFVALEKTVTELGVYTPEDLEQHLPPFLRL